MLGHQQLTTSREIKWRESSLQSSRCQHFDLGSTGAFWPGSKLIERVKSLSEDFPTSPFFFAFRSIKVRWLVHSWKMRSFFLFGIYGMNFWKEFPKISFWRNSVVISDNSQIYVLQKESHSEPFSLCFSHNLEVLISWNHLRTWRELSVQCSFCTQILHISFRYRLHSLTLT